MRWPNASACWRAMAVHRRLDLLLPDRRHHLQRILQPGEIEALDRTNFPRVLLPQPATLFQARAARLQQLADGHAIGDYLRFAARLVQAQHQQAGQLPAAEPPADALIRRANATGMPLMPTSEPLPAVWCAVLRALVATLRSDAAVPAALHPVLDQLASADDAVLDALARQVLADNLGREDLAAAPIVMAALQVVFAKRAAAVPEAAVPYAEPATVCPICASAPVASVLRIGGQAGGHRYLHCSVCATEWHMVRVKCSHCESTEGVRYQGMLAAEGSAGEKPPAQVVVAETCEQCHTYRKLVDQEKDPFAEPLADDLAAITLDLLMGDSAFARASGNPLLAIERPLVS
jgi:FdhE protein